FVLIVNYHLNTFQIALLFGFCAAVNIFGSPLIGKFTDRLGYRNTMIWDTVILFFVCLLYGFAAVWFPPNVAIWVVCCNFLLDAILSTTSLATNLYVRDIADNSDEVTSSLSTGISINHLISIASAPLGGWVWHRFGVEVLFSFAAVMAVANSLCACMIRKKPVIQEL
ncbi:MAG: MFS transporter, partial [Lentisphaeria bacterium]